MITTTTLTGATLPDGRVRNVVVRHGRVSQVRPVGVPDPHHEVVDLTGYVLLPAPAEPHVHLDRALTWHPTGSDPGGRDGAVRAWRVAPARFAANDLRRRARVALGTLAGHGVTAVRAHLEVGGFAGTSLRGIEVLRELRGEFAPLLDLRVVVTPAPDVPERLVVDAFAAGADLLGGTPHLVGDVREGTLRLLRLADRVDADLDLHVDDHVDPRVLAVGHLARMLRASGFGRRVTASHLTVLGLLRGPALVRVAETIAASGLRCVVLPSASGPASGPASAAGAGTGSAGAGPAAGATAGAPQPPAPWVRALLDAGASVSAGGDHVRAGMRADPLETAWLLVTRFGLSPEEAWAAVGAGAREGMDLPPAGIEPGAAADLLAVRAGSLAEALAIRPADRVVLHRGRVVTPSQVTAVETHPRRGVAVA